MSPNGAILPNRLAQLFSGDGRNPIRLIPNSPYLKNPNISDLAFNVDDGSGRVFHFSKDVTLPDSFVGMLYLFLITQVFFEDRPIGRPPFLVFSDDECEIWKSKSLKRDAYISELHYKNRTTVTNIPVFHNGVLQTYLRKVLWPTGEIQYYNPDAT